MSKSKGTKKSKIIAWNESFLLEVAVYDGEFKHNQRIKSELRAHGVAFNSSLESTSEVFGECWHYTIECPGMRIATLIFYIVTEYLHPIPPEGWQRIPGYVKFDDRFPWAKKM